MKVTPCTFCQVSCWFGENKERCPKYSSEAKPAHVQSADITLIEIEIALDRALHFKVNDTSDDTINAYEMWRAEKLKDFKQKIESRDAAQRQAGRKEADDLAFKTLEAFGVPRGRAVTVQNGIMVLQDRMRKAIETEMVTIESLAKRYAAVVEAARKVSILSFMANPCPTCKHDHCIAARELVKALRDLDEGRKG